MRSNNFSIIKFDLDKLDKKLDECENKTGKTPYIFMSNDTANGVLFELNPSCFCKHNFKTNLNEKIGEYKACKIYINNNLNFGEIEIR